MMNLSMCVAVRDVASWRDFSPRRSRRWACGITAICLVLLSGCPKSQAPPESQSNAAPYAGTEVRVALPAELGLKSSWTPGFEDWAAETTASYDVSEIDFSSASTNNNEWLTSLKAAAPTLVLLPTPLVNQLTGEGLIAPIPESALAENELDWDHLLLPVRDALGMLGNDPAIFPTTCTSLVVYYRADLLDTAGREPPETWEEYDALVTSVGDWAPDHIAIEPRGDASLATLFLARAAVAGRSSTQFSFELDVSSGEPLIATEPFQRALSQMAALSAALSEESQAATFDDCREAYACGKAAIAIGALSNESAECETEPTEAAFAFSTVPLPGSRSVFDRESGQWTTLESPEINRPALCGFQGYSACVLSDASEIERAAAWDLWGKLVRLQSDGVITPLPGLSCSSSPSAIPPVGGHSLDASVATLDQAMSPVDPQLVAELPCLGRERLLATLTESLKAALNDGTAPDAALQQASQEWSRIIEDIGRTQVLNSYRQRLGLSQLP